MIPTGHSMNDPVFVLDNGSHWYTIMGKADRKSQTLCEKGAESVGSLEKKMAELLKDRPLVCAVFLFSGAAGCASPVALTDHLDGEIRATDSPG
jgi:hypothetical protein